MSGQKTHRDFTGWRIVGILAGGTITLESPKGERIEAVFTSVNQRRKSCPNAACPGGWLPDVLRDGTRRCPVCKTEFRVEDKE